MRKDQWARLGQLWTVVGLPSYQDFIDALGGTDIELDAIQEATVFYGALKRLSIKDQIQVNSTVTIETNPVMKKLVVEWLKLSNEMGEAAVQQAKEILGKTKAEP